MTETTSRNPTNFAARPRLSYQAPRLTRFGHVAALTAAGTGAESELNPSGQVNCNKKKSYVPDPTGNCI